MAVNKHVIIYSTPTCAFCKTEKQWLESKGIEYHSIDITEDNEAKEHFEKSGYRGVPVTFIQEGESSNVEDITVVEGFDRKKLSEALGL